jgi:hypothetical protein
MSDRELLDEYASETGAQDRCGSAKESQECAKAIEEIEAELFKRLRRGAQ